MKNNGSSIKNKIGKTTLVLSRNANERLLKIHQLIAAQRFPNTFSLARDFEISVKTLQRDIQWMRDHWDLPIVYNRYPIESISKFETKTSESSGWLEQTGVDFVIRRSCIISLSNTLGLQPSAFRPSLARVTFTGYVLPGTTPGPGQTPLPFDLEQAAVEQVAYWFQIRDKLGLKTRWPHGGTYEGFFPLDLLPNVQTVLNRYERYSL